MCVLVRTQVPAARCPVPLPLQRYVVAVIRYIDAVIRIRRSTTHRRHKGHIFDMGV